MRTNPNRKTSTSRCWATAMVLLLPLAAIAQDTTMEHQAGMDHQAAMGHDASQDAGMAAPQEGGQSAFAAIQEIVNILYNDLATDWSHVDIEALRQHLIDMSNVTLGAQVQTVALADGAQFIATSTDPAIASSIANMVLAHAATMNGVEGWKLTGEKIDSGAMLTVQGTELDTQKINALGFIGLMTVGMHHQSHHLALASGANPHGH